MTKGKTQPRSFLGSTIFPSWVNYILQVIFFSKPKTWKRKGSTKTEQMCTLRSSEPIPKSVPSRHVWICPSKHRGWNVHSYTVYVSQKWKLPVQLPRVEWENKLTNHTKQWWKWTVSAVHCNRNNSHKYTHLLPFYYNELKQAGRRKTSAGEEDAEGSHLPSSPPGAPVPCG